MTNSVSAVTTAWFNGAPVVVLAGRAPDYRWGAGSLQEMDHARVVSVLADRRQEVPSSSPGLAAAFAAAASFAATPLEPGEPVTGRGSGPSRRRARPAAGR